MSRHLHRASLALAVLLLTASLAIAADSAPATGKARPLDGKELFKNQCKVCHGPKAEAGEYTPMSLIQEQWEEFFAKTFADSHADLAAPGAADRKVTDVIEAPMLEAIRKFCVDHAADSEQPMTCG